MAHVVTGSIVADISGKVGDNVYSRNRGGLYVKQYVRTLVSPTPALNIALGYFAAANSAWSVLDDDQFNNWAAFTKNFTKSTFNGSRRQWSPKGLFIHGYVNRRFTGFFTNPEPVMPGNSGFESLTISIPDAFNLFFTLNGGLTNTDYYVIYLSTIPHNLQVRSLNSVQQVSFFSFNYQAAFNFNLRTEWITRYGGILPIASERLFGSVKIIHKLSGIQVGFGWNSVKGPPIGPPYNIGNENARASSAGLTSPRLTPITTTSAGDIPGINVHFSASGGSVLVGIYSDVTGVPTSRLVQSLPTIITAVNDFQFIPFTAPLSLNASTAYWLAVVGTTPSLISFDATPTLWYRSSVSAFSLPTTMDSESPQALGGSWFGTVTP
jgi:hypothetical protein